MRTLVSLLFCAALAACGAAAPTDLAFGLGCAADAECASGKCFVGGTESYCSLSCTAATQATDCPVPPTSGTCNMKGYCKK